MKSIEDTLEHTLLLLRELQRPDIFGVTFTDLLNSQTLGGLYIAFADAMKYDEPTGEQLVEMTELHNALHASWRAEIARDEEKMKADLATKRAAKLKARTIKSAETRQRVRMSLPK